MATEVSQRATYETVIVQDVGNRSQVCHDPKRVTQSGGIFRYSNPLHFATPLLFLQLSVISLASMSIDKCLKPLGQASNVSQILGGILLGPSFLSHRFLLGSRLFPTRGSMLFNTLASFGLMFFLFSIGVKMDSGMMVRPERVVVAIGFCAIFVTMAITVPFSFLLQRFAPMDDSLSESLILLAGSQCLTHFHNIVALLTELKLLNSDLGRLAISTSVFCDVLGIGAVAISFAVSQSTSDNPVQPIMAVVSTLALILTLIYIVKPLILYKLKRVPESKPVSEPFINAVLLLVLLAGLGSEIIGQHYVLGTLVFVFGLVVPEGTRLGASIISKLEYPMYILYLTYLCSGLKTNIFAINPRSIWVVKLVVLASCLVKIGAIMVPAAYYNMSMGDALVIGLMMNARGICDLTLYNLWKDTKGLQA